MSWAVVKFKDSDDTLVAPINWLKGCKCLWPPKSLMFQIASLIDKGIAVIASEAWESHPIEIMGIYANCNEARLNLPQANENSPNLPQAEENSDLNTTDAEDCGRGKRKKRKTMKAASLSLTESEDILTNGEDQSMEQPEMNDIKCFTVPAENIIAHSNNVSASPMIVNATPVSENLPMSIKAFQRFLLQELQTIRANQNTMMQTLNDILQKLNATNSTSINSSDYDLIEDILELLPALTDDDFNVIEERLRDEKSASQMILYLGRLGGVNVEQGIKLMLRRLLSDEVATTFSLLGFRGKPAFQTTHSCKVIISTIRRHPLWNNTGEKDIERVVSNWLRHAKGRMQQRRLSNVKDS